ncbi:hypothetical protein MTO96_013910 [Rhipicephalus appendiculatus]
MIEKAYTTYARSYELHHFYTRPSDSEYMGYGRMSRHVSNGEKPRARMAAAASPPHSLRAFKKNRARQLRHCQRLVGPAVGLGVLFDWSSPTTTCVRAANHSGRWWRGRGNSSSNAGRGGDHPVDGKPPASHL